MDFGIIALIGIIVLAIFGTGLIMRSKEGSFGWEIKTRIFQATSQFQGATRPDLEQIQKNGKNNKQSASKDAKSKQEQVGGEKNEQRIK